MYEYSQYDGKMVHKACADLTNMSINKENEYSTLLTQDRMQSHMDVCKAIATACQAMPLNVIYHPQYHTMVVNAVTVLTSQIAISILRNINMP